jgi:hypothetical protein
MPKQKAAVPRFRHPTAGKSGLQSLLLSVWECRVPLKWYIISLITPGFDLGSTAV